MIYRYKGNFYLFLGVARHHGDDNAEFAAYIPLRVEPEWSGTSRIALRPLAEFRERFELIGDRLP